MTDQADRGGVQQLIENMRQELATAKRTWSMPTPDGPSEPYVRLLDIEGIFDRAALQGSGASPQEPPKDFDEAVIQAFIDGEDQYSCCHPEAKMPDGSFCPFWCFWNSRAALCNECEGFRRYVLHGVHDALKTPSEVGAAERTQEDQHRKKED